MNDQVIYLTGDFDAEALVRIRKAVGDEVDSPPLTLDFRDVRSFQPFALAALFELINRVGKIRTRSLCQQHEVLLGYLGLTPRVSN